MRNREENERALSELHTALLDASNENENVSKEPVQVRKMLFAGSVKASVYCLLGLRGDLAVNYQQVHFFARKLIDELPAQTSKEKIKCTIKRPTKETK